MNKMNYQKELDKIISLNQKEGYVPTLLLHSCCAPCSSYVLEYLSEYFYITVYYYNPNIYPIEEYHMRVCEQQEFIEKISSKYPIKFIEGSFEFEKFYEYTRGLEQEPEGGERCFKCFRMRLQNTAEVARNMKFDYFATTLTISPLKNADKLNELGKEIEEKLSISYLVSDFKKRNGYKRSVELSAEFGMYRQNYCGCIFSKKESEQRMIEKESSKQ